MKDIHEMAVVIRNVIEATFSPVIGMIEFTMRDGSTELVDCGNSFIGYVSAIRDERQPCMLSTVSPKYGTATFVRTEFLETVYFSECERKCAVTAVTKTGKEITLCRGTKNECLGYYNELRREVPELCRPA